jgi:hypothetical protein
MAVEERGVFIAVHTVVIGKGSAQGERMLVSEEQ